ERQALIAQDPTTKLETIRIDQADPQILSIAQCRRLIQSAKEIDPDMLSYFALSLFCGVRPDECARLTKKDVDLKRGQIVISGEVSKTRNRRIITLLPPAERILSKYTFGKFSVNFTRRRTAIKKHAKIKKWPSDVLRHTAASHFYNIYGMDEATKQLGHSAAIMLKHYRQMISKEETEEWLNIS
ncbi:tyrosine-type recombinase/integrase, partial [Verrucomicrobia bacterium]|nr:tyrosine-type recombinase/integrase [Verrucomicrobiota bacterium]